MGYNLPGMGERTKRFDDCFSNSAASSLGPQTLHYPLDIDNTIMELYPIAKYRIIDKHLAFLLFEI